MESVILANLWSLACNVVVDSVAKDVAIRDKEQESSKNKKQDKKKKDQGAVGKDMRTSTRCILYHATMKDCITNFPLRNDGSIILRYFATDDYDKPEWPDYFITFWNEKIESCRENLPKWLKQENCFLTTDEHAEMSMIMKLNAYIGSIILAQVDKTEKFANHSVNKHWPSNFKSGESVSGLLQV